MAAQSLKARVYWDATAIGGDVFALHRDHQLDLDQYANAVEHALMLLAAETIDFAPRSMTARISDDPASRHIYFWMQEGLPRETWIAAFELASHESILLVPQQEWEFTVGPEDFAQWHEDTQRLCVRRP